MPRSLPSAEKSLTLLPAAADDFLPPIGGWSRSMGTYVLIALGSIVLAACIWPFQETVRASGIVRPAGENSIVQTSLGGRLRQVLIRPDAQVKAGQILARLDVASLRDAERQLRSEDEQLRRQLMQAQQQESAMATQIASENLLSQAQINSGRSEIAKAQASLGFASSELNRYASLLSSGAVPQGLVDEKNARHTLAVSELQQARQGVEQQLARHHAETARLLQGLSSLRSTTAELRRQRAALQTRRLEVERGLVDATIRAPISGSVISTSLRHAGQVLSPGEIVARLAPADAPLDVKILVPARDIAPLRIGQEAYLRVTGCPYSDFGIMRGQVMSVSADAVGAGAPPSAAPPMYELSVRPHRRVLEGVSGACRLRLGMDLQADLVTRRSTVMSYLLRKTRLAFQL